MKLAWQQCGNTMQSVFMHCITRTTGFNLDELSFKVHSFKDNGDHVLVNVEYVDYDGSVNLQRIKLTNE
ncbi:hypothetical protein ZPAH1_orf00132 [Aeromonas phage ZPAH1]|nr:hypothetical protein ASwh1_83 [Aeromonas phage Aswh_1]QQG33894.1 hypothetical protein ZPAH1_orf00132 [Aeromonas phage ZPAH1]